MPLSLAPAPALLRSASRRMSLWESQPLRAQIPNRAQSRSDAPVSFPHIAALSCRARAKSSSRCQPIQAHPLSKSRSSIPPLNRPRMAFVRSAFRRESRQTRRCLNDDPRPVRAPVPATYTLLFPSPHPDWSTASSSLLPNPLRRQGSVVSVLPTRNQVSSRVRLW